MPPCHPITSSAAYQPKAYLGQYASLSSPFLISCQIRVSPCHVVPEETFLRRAVVRRLLIEQLELSACWAFSPVQPEPELAQWHRRIAFSPFVKGYRRTARRGKRDGRRPFEPPPDRLWTKGEARQHHTRLYSLSSSRQPRGGCPLVPSPAAVNYIASTPTEKV